MIAPELLNILCCPETNDPLRLAEPHEVEKMNERIQRGELKSKQGSVLKDPLEGALVCEKTSVIYPIRNQIPILLIPEGIILSRIN